MGDIIRGRGLARGALRRVYPVNGGPAARGRGDGYLLVNNDAVEECAAMGDGPRT